RVDTAFTAVDRARRDRLQHRRHPVRARRDQCADQTPPHARDLSGVVRASPTLTRVSCPFARASPTLTADGDLNAGRTQAIQRGTRVSWRGTRGRECGTRVAVAVSTLGPWRLRCG